MFLCFVEQNIHVATVGFCTLSSGHKVKIHIIPIILELNLGLSILCVRVTLLGNQALGLVFILVPGLGLDPVCK